ncbi:EKA-like protein [Blumeria hordei DH14]|uniref:EKA-like protein n=1 Tax=Blumeria graminis f. sp. hordei (strain DH14) TaxID=546991 RepID=N1JLU1_BLUG1|nr:EKA-like protein [Blumeria hordei DH14]
MWNVEDSEDSKVTVIPATTTRKIAVPAARRAAIVHTSKYKGATSPKNPPEGTSGIKKENTAYRSKYNPKLTEEYPSELRALTEAEERRTAKTAENVKICTAAINGIENALSSLSKGMSVQFIDSMKVLIRAAIAQFMISGLGTVLQVLPSRPETQATGIKITEYPLKSKMSHKAKRLKTMSSSLKQLGPRSHGIV